MDEYNNSQEKLISEFNEAKFQIFRLHNIWLQCKDLREGGKLMQVRWKLDSAAIELWTDAKRIDGDEKEIKEGEKIEGKENNKKGWIEKIKDIDEKINNSIADKKPADFYDSLVEKERLLRELQDAAGKGSKYTSADDEFNL